MNNLPKPPKINFYGMWTLYKKEVYRFLKVYNQTLIAPMVTSLLFLAIFDLSIGHHVSEVHGVNFNLFVASGLIMMTVIQQSFANTSSSLVMSKVIGMIVDLLMPPLSSGEIIFAMTMASITRGVLVGIMVTLGVWFFVPMEIYNLPLAAFYIISAAMLLSLVGIIAGIISDTFDHMAAITSYVITPLSFLSGTFYSVKNLPEFWYHVSHLNPFFYMIDGFRYAITGYADGSILAGIISLTALNIILYIYSYWLLYKGYKLKS